MAACPASRYEAKWFAQGDALNAVRASLGPGDFAVEKAKPDPVLQCHWAAVCTVFSRVLESAASQGGFGLR